MGNRPILSYPRDSIAVMKGIEGSQPPRAKASRLAGGQYGVITRKQATSLGMSGRAIQRLLVTGEWERVRRGVFRLASSGRSWRQDVMIACQWIGSGAVASHRSAAAIFEFQGAYPVPVEITVPVPGFPVRAGLLLRRTGYLPACDITTVSGIPVTTAERTLIDVGSVVDASTLEIFLEDAFNRGLVTIPGIWERLTDVAARGRPGPPALRGLLQLRDPGATPTQNGFETMMDRLLRDWGFPPPERQYRIGLDDGTVFILDFAYPDQRVAIECDGFQDHGKRGRWEKDIQRRNRLAGMGFTVIQATWWEVKRRSPRLRRDLTRVLRKTG